MLSKGAIVIWEVHAHPDSKQCPAQRRAQLSKSKDSVRDIYILELESRTKGTLGQKKPKKRKRKKINSLNLEHTFS